MFAIFVIIPLVFAAFIALLGYAKRGGPDDFAGLTGFLEQHPQSSWRAALLTDLGFEYYNTAHYSLAIEAWREAWALAKNAADRKALALVDLVLDHALVHGTRDDEIAFYRDWAE